MKRLLSVFLLLALVFSLVACNASNHLPGTFVPLESSSQTTELQTVPTDPQPEGSSPAQTVPEQALPTQWEETQPIETQPVTTQPIETQPAIQDTFPEDTRPRPTVPEQDQQPVETQPEQTQPEETQPEETQPTPTEPESSLDRNGSYTHKDDVALYLHLYGHLPYNFITKSEAKNYGWRSGSLEKYAPGKCIGGDRFYNKEGRLPNKAGRYYYECDIDTLGSYSDRGVKRIVYSNDGLIYYTGDHYESFTLLYGEP